MLDKSFDPATAEPRIYAKWEQLGSFRPSGEGAPFTIVIPPPNVTGSLHLGHALDCTLQDILCRFERMRGRSVLWQPGTDHAGIATQMVVERQLMERQEPSRRAMGREKFLERVWAWKAESGGAIIEQLKRLGASCDWSRERFTMDEGLSAAVRKVFVALYREGLIYRDTRLVNWDPKLETAISDLEVENTEVDGHFWHFKYPLEHGETYEFPIAHDENGEPTEWATRDYVSIATTRPETMLGDGAVAVHPSDKRYAPIVGKNCLLPLADRYIPIITDDYPDPDFGSGAVKITGAHDFNDYKVAIRNGIELYVLMDKNARMLDAEHVPEKYRGLDRYEARKAVVADIEARGLLIKVEDKKIMQPFGDRSGVVIEPMLTEQWYVDAEKLAGPAIEAVEKGDTRFVPENWTKTFFQWMRNIEPWCISRQLWWGHRIPAWYGPDGAVFVGEDEEEAVAQAKAHYARDVAVSAGAEPISPLIPAKAGIQEGKNGSPLSRGQAGVDHPVTLSQDDDVLDTWFSSALWPFTTLGWPEESPFPSPFGRGVRGEGSDREASVISGADPHPRPLPHRGRGEEDAAVLQTRYPTSVLVTAFDIIFFWVARMMMMGLHFMKDVPFRDVYLHALVVDEKGRKMSKSKGNVIDPLVLIDKYGADALRFTLAAQAALGRNIRLAESRVEGYRNFGTKLWNAARFCEMNGCGFDPKFDPASANETLNKWIVHETGRAVSEVTAALQSYRFNDAAAALYRFVWNVFCDWHLELAKPVLSGPDGAAKEEAQKTTAFALAQILKLLHPFMPFITEELWAETGARSSALIVADWPKAEDFARSPGADAEINWLIGLVTAVRSARAEMNVPAGAKIPLDAIAPGAGAKARLAEHEAIIMKLSRLSGITKLKAPADHSVQIVHDGGTYALPLEGIIDIGAERTRLDREVDKCAREIAAINGKLANANFVERAPSEIVEENRERRAAVAERRDKLSAALRQLS